MKERIVLKIKPEIIEQMSNAGYTGFDMHTHTNHSWDAITKVPDLIKRAKKKNMGFAVTDHNRISGALDACKNKAVPIIPGIEITTLEGNHVILYFYTISELKEFFNKEIKHLEAKNPYKLELTVKDTLLFKEKYNCVTTLPHPFAPGRLNIKKIPLDKELIKKINAIEIFNAYCTKRMNKKATDWLHLIEKPHTAGSDTHMLFELGTALTFVKADNTEDALDELRKGLTIAAGKEESLLKKSVSSVEKISTIIRRSVKEKHAKSLFKSWFGKKKLHLIKKHNKNTKFIKKNTLK